MVCRSLGGIMPDQELTCCDCRETFVFTEGEQEFYRQKNFSPPKRCKSCREKRKQQKPQKTQRGSRERR